MTPPRTEAGDAVTDLVLTIFRLNGSLLAAAERIAAPAGLTAARWQVIGAVLRQAKSVSEIARDMGLARQSVQRLADVLVAEGLAAYADNPVHQRAKLFAPTKAGFAAIQRLAERQHVFANALSNGIDAGAIRECTDLLLRIDARVVEAQPASSND